MIELNQGFVKIWSLASLLEGTLFSIFFKSTRASMLQFEKDESVIKEDFTIQKVYFFFQNIPVSLSHPFLLERVMTEQQKAQNNSTAPNITLKTKRTL